MNGNKRKLTRNIILIIALFISFSGCTDLGMMGEEAQIEFNEASVAADAETLTDAAITFASGDTAASVTADFSLLTSGDAGSTITWSSSNTEIITINEDGSTTVTRPSGSNVVVELTATITKGTVTTTKIISVTVLAVEVVNNTITFESLVAADGTDGTADTTTLTLTFSADPTTLTSDNITVTGATKGALSGSGTTRTLAISNITVANGETVSVAITNPGGFTISGSPQTAVVYKLCPAITISSITPDGNSSVSPDSNIEIVFSDSLDGATKGTVSFASPAVTFTEGGNATITFGTTNNANDTITINPNADLAATNHTSITVSGFRDTYSRDVNCSDSDYYFPVRGAMDLYFPFTDGSLTDASGRGVTLVPTGGPTLTAGYPRDAGGNDAYSFDGINDYMQVSGDLGIDCDADFTISAWIYLTSIGNYKAIVSNYHTVAANGLMFRVNSSWAGHTNALDLSEGYSNNGVLSTGSWLHVVAAYTEADSKVQFYVNGVDAGYTSTGYNIVDPLLSDSRNKFAIGADYLFGGDARYFPGTIDEVRFYKYALTATEVGNLYRNDDINDSTP